MKFCTNCGNQLGDERFCTKCGAKVDDAAPYVSVPAVGAKNKSKTVIGIVIAVILVLIVAVAAVTVFGGRSYKSLVKAYVKASMSGDVDKIISLIPDEMIDYIMEEEGYSNRRELVDDMRNLYEGIYESIEKEYGVSLSEIDCSYEITEEEDLRGSDWRDIRDECAEMGINPKQAKEIEVELRISVGGEEDTANIDLTIVKIGRSWYVIDFD